jgi:hypothetical protein
MLLEMKLNVVLLIQTGKRNKMTHIFIFNRSRDDCFNIFVPDIKDFFFSLNYTMPITC